MSWRPIPLVVAAAVSLAAAPPLIAQAPYRQIGQLRLSVLGVSASVDPAKPVVPKNTETGVRIVVTAGANPLSAADVARFLGAGFGVEAELSGPGLSQTVSLPLQPQGAPLPEDPLLLRIPALTIAGDYALSNIRIVAGGRPVLDVTPSEVTLEVIDQILVTSVKTRPLTLDEIRDKGIVLDSDDYLGFQFTLGMTLDSKVVNLSFPVVFNRDGVQIPQPQQDPVEDPSRVIEQHLAGSGAPAPELVPILLKAQDPDGGPQVELTLPDGQPIRIPSVLVIPGNVGYLKQFFSAQLFVANGAPLGADLTVRDVTGTIRLPPGDDGVTGTADDPLALPETDEGVQPATLPVRGLGPDGAPGTPDDPASFGPTEQGQAEFLVRGEKEGFHTLDFDIAATLDGLPVGPVTVTGQASGGVLVRNPYFNMTFTVPSVVRAGETFSLFTTVTNIGQGTGNDVSVSLDSAAISGLTLLTDPVQQITTLAPGDAKVLEYAFRAERTGKVVATYLAFDTTDGASGDLRFTLGVGERNVPLSPDTLALPTAVGGLPASVVQAAMRVLGQAWSLANAPRGTLPAGVQKTTTTVVTEKALDLAEAGLRVTLGEPLPDAIRDLAFDFYGGSPLDPGFDQLLRETEAGHDLAAALGAELALAMAEAGGPLPYEQAAAELAASGPDFVSFAVESRTDPVEVVLEDALGRRLASGRSGDGAGVSEIPGGVVIPLGSPADAPLLGLFTAPSASPYTLGLSGAADLSLTLPRGDGTFLRGRVSTVAPARLVVDLSRSDALTVEEDRDGDGVYETQQALAQEVLASAGPQLLAASVIGPETIAGASADGVSVAFLFDRVVDGATSALAGNYSIPSNAVRGAKRQLSGRLVFASLEAPEGRYLPTTVTVTRVTDSRGVVGPTLTVPLATRIETPGAVVMGRVVSADGTPVPGGEIQLSSGVDSSPCPQVEGFSTVAAVPVGEDGGFDLRYVRQSQCGFRFKLTTQDPDTGLNRSTFGRVRLDGERIILDIALVGRGSVAGIVRDLTGQPVPGARVVVRSVTDPTVAAAGDTDASGAYLVSGLTVGPVTVEAGKGPALGRGAGRIERAGTTATVDVTLDGGAASVAGSYLRVQGGVASPVGGVLLSYNLAGTVVGYAFTQDDGSYRFDAMPVGPFLIFGGGASVSGTASAGDHLTGVNLAQEIDAPELGVGDVRGSVRLPDGSPAPGVIVARDVSGAVVRGGVVTAVDGTFDLPGIPLGESVQVGAVTPDRLRSGTVTVTVDPDTGVSEGVVITLSGVGSVEFTVLDPAGLPLANQSVSLLTQSLTLGGCHNPCGCATRATDANGRVRFDDLPLGRVSAQAIRQAPGYVDVAVASGTIVRDGDTAFAVTQLRGAGVVSGVARGPDGVFVTGGQVSLSSLDFVNDGKLVCGLVSGVSQVAPIDPATGAFRFAAVNVGPVSVTATNPFQPNPVGASGALVSDGQEVSFDLQFVDTTAGELTGTVYLPDGQTPAGAGVDVTAAGRLPAVTVKTDAAGQFHFARIFPEGPYAVTVSDPVTGGLAQESIYLRAAQDLAIAPRLKGRGTVRVRVVDGADQPVESASVTVAETAFPRSTYEAVLDASNQGVARFPRVFEGPVSVSVTDLFGRGGRASATLPGPGAEIEVTVRLTTTGTVQGRFLMPDGTTPIPFGSLALLQGGRTVGQVTTGSAGDEVGRYGFDHVPAGDLRLEAEDPLTGRTGFAVGTIDTEGQVLDLDVVAQGLGTVAGLVTGNGVPQPGAEVTLASGSFKAMTTADAEGRYQVGGVPEGRVTATASVGSGVLSGTAGGTLAGDGSTLTLDVALQDSGAVLGQVVEADGVTPALASVTIQVGGGPRLTTATSLDGSFRFDRVPAGHAVLTADKLSSVDRGSATLDVTPGEVSATLVLNGVGGLTGHALDSTGQPTAGRVWVRGTGSFPWAFVVNPAGDGAFTLPEVLAGPVTLSLAVDSGDFTLYGTASGEVVPGETATLDVQVQPSATVTGLVLRADGTTPAYGATVKVFLPPNRGAVTVQTGSDGRFRALGVPLGDFELSVQDPLTAGVARLGGLTLSADQNGQEVDVGTLVLDDSPLQVVSVEPPDGATGVAVDTVVRLVLSDPVASNAGISITRIGGSLGSGALSEGGTVVTFAPASGAWPDAAELVVQVTTAATDVYGRHPLQTFTSRFHTVDLSPPKVVGVSPANLAIQVGESSTVAVTFDEPLGAATDLGGLMTLTGPAGPVAGATALASPEVAVFTPAAPLPLNGVFALAVNGAVDASGNQQTVAFTSLFKTLDTVPPVLSLKSPASGGWTRLARAVIDVSVVDALAGPAAGSGTMDLDGVQVPAVAFSAALLRYTPTADLAEGLHTVAVTAPDVVGNLGTLSDAFFVDSVPPSAAAVGGVAEGAVLRGTVTFSGTAEDATSGVTRVDLFRDGVKFLTLTAPGLAAEFNTAGLSEGPHVLTAQATDVAGNVGPVGPPVSVVVDNQVLTVTITSPAAGATAGDAVTVTVTVSEPVERVEFQIGALTVVDAAAPYEAAFDLTDVPEGTATLTATAFGTASDTGSASQSLVVDHTPPAAPDPARIKAESAGAGFATVTGAAGAVETSAAVEASDLATGVAQTTAAAQDGSFSLRIQAAIGETLSLTATDAAGNESAATLVDVTPGATEEGVPLTGLDLWVSADQGVTADAGGAVSGWSDRSGQGNDLSQADPAAQPVLVPDGFDGWPVLRFDGQHDLLAFTRRSTAIRTVFWVVAESADATSNYRFLLGDGSATYHFVGGLGAPGPIWYPSGTSPAILDGQTRVNGEVVDGTVTPRPRTLSVISLVTTGPVTASNFGGGNSAGRSWWGDLAELIVYDRELSSSEREAVEGYLVRKYRPYTPPLGTPGFQPNGGVFDGSTTVTITTSTPGAEIRYTLDGSDPTDQSTVYTGPFELAVTAVVKARAFESVEQSEVATATFLRREDAAPSATPGLLLWLRADAGIATDGGSWVSDWVDQSGAGRHGRQPAGTKSPRLVPDAVNGLPALRFDGQKDEMPFPRLDGQIRTVFWVVAESPDATASYRFLLGDGATSYDFIGGSGAPGSIWLSGTASPSIVNGQTFVNGRPVDGVVEPRPRQMSVISLVTTGPVTASNFGGGNVAGRNWWGDLAELIVYDRPLTAAERRGVEDYLLAKYAPTGTATAPIPSSPGGEFEGSVTVRLSDATPGTAIYYTLDGSEPSIDSTPYTAPFQLTETTTVKAKAFRDDLTPSDTVTLGFTNAADFTPRDVAGLTLWLRADAGVPSGVGDLWQDQSGLGNDATQENGARVPVLAQAVVSGLPAMRFDGQKGEVYFPRMTEIRTVFWVAAESPDATAGYRFLLGDGATSYDFIGGSGAPGPIWLQGTTATSILNGQTFVNGTPVDGVVELRPRQMSVISVVTTGPVTASNFGGGNITGRNWWGDLAELVVYDRPLTPGERRAVEDYLLAKYQTTGQVTAPQVSPLGGEFTGSVTVSLADATPGATIRYTLDRSEPSPGSPAYDGPFDLTETTALKAKAFRDDLATSETVTVGFTNAADFTPRDLTGLTLWLRADAGVPSGVGDLWQDQSGLGNDAWQANGSRLPVLAQDVVNGLPAMRFDGRKGEVDFPPLTTVRTVFWVVAEDAAATADYRPLLGDGASRAFLGGNGAPGPIWYSGASASVRNGQTFLNGRPVDGTAEPRPRAMSVISLVTTDATSASDFGAASSYHWWGDLAELIVYDRALTDAERQQVEDYLNARYEIFLR